MFRKTTTIIVLLCISSHLFGQTNIKGKIIDEDQEGLDLVQVSMLRLSDSTYVNSNFTDQDGSYLLQDIEAGSYTLQVNLLGYLEYNQEVTINSEQREVVLDPIELELQATKLEEVTVVGKVPYIERQLDRIVMNVDAHIANMGSNGIEILERAPGVRINDGSISLKGRSEVQLFINDKPSFLGGAELESYLSSLPASSILKIEIIMNPPAQYSAAGTAGIINILMKRDKRYGFNGDISVSYRQGKFMSGSKSLNLNYNRKKISFYAILGAGIYTSFREKKLTRTFENEAQRLLSSFKQNSTNYRRGEYLRGTVGMDYYINDRTTFGVSHKRFGSPAIRYLDFASKFMDENDEEQFHVVADDRIDALFGQQIYRGYVKHKIDTLGSSISVDLDFVRYNTIRTQEYINSTFDTSDVLIEKIRTDGELPSDFRILAAKSEYIKPFANSAKLEVGWKSVQTTTDNEAIYSNTVGGVTTPDFGISNQFLYKESIHAAYVSFNRSLGPFKLQLGLRAEQTKLEANQIGNVVQSDTSFTNKYTSIYPTFYGSWKADSLKKNVFSISFGRRIERPYFHDLMPYTSIQSKYLISQGNPELQPSFSNSLSISHTYSSNISTTLSYSKTLDGIHRTITIIDKIEYTKKDNVLNQESISLDVNGTFKINKWYKVYAYAELGYRRFSSSNATALLDRSGSYFFVQASQNFSLPKGWRLSLNGDYSSSSFIAQFNFKPYWKVNFGLQKRIFNNKVRLGLVVTDIFYSVQTDGFIDNLRLTKDTWDSVKDSRKVILTVSTRFGKSKFSKKRYKGSGSREEQNRANN